MRIIKAYNEERTKEDEDEEEEEEEEEEQQTAATVTVESDWDLSLERENWVVTYLSNKNTTEFYILFYFYKKCTILCLAKGHNKSQCTTLL
ncbi:WSSV194 [White spot syndrome virus]|uniref:WSSV194 n=1 Tax=White spot syndrome virus TaxID=342409 RepID=A0A2I6SBU5_9VIRU|nr:WSSV194 [White spot syndrome virus]